MDPENYWVKKAAMIPWKAIEETYASLFPSKTGMSAKLLRMALGSLIVQKQHGYSEQRVIGADHGKPMFIEESEDMYV